MRDSGNGLTVKNGSIARIANSTFTANTVGVRNFSIVETLGNNLVRGNTNNVPGTLTAFGGL